MLNAKIMEVKDQSDKRYCSVLKSLEEMQDKINQYQSLTKS
jgi:hypothetical protein